MSGDLMLQILGASGPPVAGVEEFRDVLYPAIVASARALAPELVILAGALAVLVLDLFLPRRATRHLAWVSCGFCLAALAVLAGAAPESRGVFLGMLASDPFSSFFRKFLILGTIPILLLAWGAKDPRERNGGEASGEGAGELHFLILAALFGGMIMASATHFLTMFLSLEILSISSYVLVGYFRSDRTSAEAALKYVIYGSAASAAMAYGFSLWFGLTGSADARSLASILGGPAAIGSGADATVAVLLAMVCIFAGLAYKTSLVPMHFWTPDVYQGAPTPITAFLSVVSKGAGFALALRFFGSLAASVRSLEAGSAAAGFWATLDWSVLISASAVLTMTLGNFAALWQTNLKRLLAYSSIAHAGYLAMGLALLRPEEHGAGMETIAFYLIAYLTMNVGAFAVVILLEGRTGSVELSSYRGLGRRAPLLAFSMTVFLFSLIGVPPTAGFVGKFQLFLGVIGLGTRLQEAGAPFWWQYHALVLIAVVNTAVSAYYYLRIVKTMYLESAPAGESPREPLGLARGTPAPGVLVVAAMLFLTFYLCLRAGGLLSATLDISIHV